MNCPICKKEMIRSKKNDNTDKYICHNAKCILFLQSHELVDTITHAIETAERKGFEMARERAAKIIERAPWSVKRETIISIIRDMKPDGTK